MGRLLEEGRRGKDIRIPEGGGGGGGGGGGRRMAVGIDLGTTYSCVGVWRNGEFEVILNDYGKPTTPSCVAFTDEECLVGNSAKNQIAANPKNTVYEAKRLLGKRFDDEDVLRYTMLWPFKIIAGPDNKPMIQVKFKGNEEQFSAVRISSMILDKMRQVSAEYLGVDVKDAVIAVPASFNDSQRQATMDAAELAGLNVLQLISEPTAAAVAYGLHKKETPGGMRTVLVFDLGGGTLDVSILSINKNVFKVKATAGNADLGGADFDHRMLRHFAEEFNSQHNLDIFKVSNALRRLKVSCERAKVELSSTGRTDIQLDALYKGKNFHTSISRAKFEELNMDLFEKCMEPIMMCLKDAGINKNSIDEVVLVGGSSRIPMVQSLLQDFFGKEVLRRDINADQAVAKGAALQAAILSGHCKETQVLDLVVTDVVSLSLGVEIRNDVMSVIIPRNTPIPTKKESIYTTRFDNQQNVKFPVYEGERARTSDNNLLGTFAILGIPPAPCAEPRITVCFEIDANGILNVSAKEASGSQSRLQIVDAKGRLSEEEVNKLIGESARYESEDCEFQKKEAAKNSFVKYTYKMKKGLNQFSNKLAPAEVKKIENAISRADQWLASSGVKSIKDTEAKMEALNRVCAPLVTMLRKQGRAGPK